MRSACRRAGGHPRTLPRRGQLERRHRGRDRGRSTAQHKRGNHSRRHRQPRRRLSRLLTSAPQPPTPLPKHGAPSAVPNLRVLDTADRQPQRSAACGWRQALGDRQPGQSAVLTRAPFAGGVRGAAAAAARAVSHTAAAAVACCACCARCAAPRLANSTGAAVAVAAALEPGWSCCVTAACEAAPAAGAPEVRIQRHAIGGAGPVSGTVPKSRCVGDFWRRSAPSPNRSQHAC